MGRSRSSRRVRLGRSAKARTSPSTRRSRLRVRGRRSIRRRASTRRSSTRRLRPRVPGGGARGAASRARGGRGWRGVCARGSSAGRARGGASRARARRGRGADCADTRQRGGAVAEGLARARPARARTGADPQPPRGAWARRSPGRGRHPGGAPATAAESPRGPDGAPRSARAPASDLLPRRGRRRDAGTDRRAAGHRRGRVRDLVRRVAVPTVCRRRARPGARRHPQGRERRQDRLDSLPRRRGLVGLLLQPAQHRLGQAGRASLGSLRTAARHELRGGHCRARASLRRP